ncbi:hypothetical protein NPIL_500721, partial [Nephila pilipes]
VVSTANLNSGEFQHHACNEVQCWDYRLTAEKIPPALSQAITAGTLSVDWLLRPGSDPECLYTLNQRK